MKNLKKLGTSVFDYCIVNDFDAPKLEIVEKQPNWEEYILKIGKKNFPDFEGIQKVD